MMTNMHCLDPDVFGADRSWWLMHVAMLTLQPNKVLLRHIHRIKSQLHFRKPIVGVHMRGTDKHLEAERLRIDTYTDLAVQMMQQLGCENLFVATDDISWSREVILQALEVSSRRHGFNKKIHMVMQDNSRANGPTWDQALTVGLTEFGRNAVADTLLLADCDGWVGTKSSLFSEVSLLLGIGFHDRRMYVAADEPKFSYDWAPTAFRHRRV